METFNFAGFNFPRKVYMVPKDKPKARLGKNKSHAAYSHAPKTNEKDIISFYWQSDFMPGLRWEWCDKVDGVRFKHMGYYTGNGYPCEIMRGFIMYLPNRRGFMYGATIGKGGIAYLSRDVIPYFKYYEIKTANYADNFAEQMADKWREEQAKHEAEQGIEQARAAIHENNVEALALIKEIKAVGDFSPAICKALKEKLQSMLDERAHQFKIIAELSDNFWSAVEVA